MNFYSERVYTFYVKWTSHNHAYSVKSEIYYRLRFIFLPMFNIFGPIQIILVFGSTTLLKVSTFQIYSLAPCHVAESKGSLKKL